MPTQVRTIEEALLDVPIELEPHNPDWLIIKERSRRYLYGDTRCLKIVRRIIYPLPIMLVCVEPMDDWKIMFCMCGHSKYMHADEHDEIPTGSGYCCEKGCDCTIYVPDLVRNAFRTPSIIEQVFSKAPLDHTFGEAPTE